MSRTGPSEADVIAVLDSLTPREVSWIAGVIAFVVVVVMIVVYGRMK